MDPETETYSPAVERAAELLIHEAETTGLIREDVRNGLAAALDVEEMARALFDLDNPDLGDEWREMAWNDMGGSERSEERVKYELKATALRTALLGADS